MRGETTKQYSVTLTDEFQTNPPTREGDRSAKPLPSPLRIFQFTPLTRGGDAIGRPRRVCSIMISIRSPYARRRRESLQITDKITLFQSTPPTRGGDMTGSNVVVKSWIFQSTPPTRGGDCSTQTGSRPTYRFQSTPPTRGGDSKHLQKRRLFDCLYHTTSPICCQPPCPPIP